MWLGQSLYLDTQVYKKNGGDFSLPPSPHIIRIIDSLKSNEHFIVEYLTYKFFRLWKIML